MPWENSLMGREKRDWNPKSKDRIAIFRIGIKCQDFMHRSSRLPFDPQTSHGNPEDWHSKSKDQIAILNIGIGYKSGYFCSLFSEWNRVLACWASLSDLYLE